MITWFRVSALFFALLLAPSCVSTGSREIADSGRTVRIEADKTTKAEVSALLGFPAIVAYGEKGQETWNYYYVTEYPTATDFIPVADGLAAGFRQSTRVLRVTFDRRGVARNLEQSRVSGSPEVYPY